MSEEKQLIFSPMPRKAKVGLRRDEVVEQYLLEKIVSGELVAGTKLPPTGQMAAQLEVNVNAVQKALMRLSARGFLTRKTNMGTFVNGQNEAPQNVFLLIGPGLREEICHFDRKLSKLIESELLSRGYNPIIYDGLDQILERGSSIGSRLTAQLLGDFAHFDPKGVIEQNFVSLRIPEFVRGLKHQIVSFRPLAQGGDVSFDSAHFHAEAVRVAVERGCKNAIIVLKSPRVCFDSLDLKAFWQATETHGLNVEKVLHIDDDRGEEAPEKVLEDLLTAELKEWKNLPQRKRWDCIILRDDILTRAAALCFLREGVSIPDEILPISLINEDIDLKYGIPVVGIETPIAEMARQLVDLLDIRLKRSSGPDLAPMQLKGRVVEVGMKDEPDSSASPESSQADWSGSDASTLSEQPRKTNI